MRYNLRHGRRNSPEYNSWDRMIQRCTNPKHKFYKYYGGRGIKVCERWRNSFLHFFEDMGERPLPDHTLDRKDSNGDYEPGNCRWATRAEQTNNRSNNRLITAFGETKPLATWAREKGLSKTCLTWRMNNGWSPEEALTTTTQR